MWITETPDQWPKLPRRIFAVTLPISGPIWCALWFGTMVAFLAVFLFLIVVGVWPCFFYKIWTGTKIDLVDLVLCWPVMLAHHFRKS